MYICIISISLCLNICIFVFILSESQNYCCIILIFVGSYYISNYGTSIYNVLIQIIKIREKGEECQSIIYYFKIRKSGRAEADFGGGISIFNLLFQIMKIREGRGWFWWRSINFFYISHWRSGRVEVDFPCILKLPAWWYL